MPTPLSSKHDFCKKFYMALVFALLFFVYNTYDPNCYLHCLSICNFILLQIFIIVSQFIIVLYIYLFCPRSFSNSVSYLSFFLLLPFVKFMLHCLNISYFKSAIQTVIRKLCNIELTILHCFLCVVFVLEILKLTVTEQTNHQYLHKNLSCVNNFI